MPDYTGNAIVDWFLAVAGNILTIFCVYNGFQYLVQKAWGAMAGFSAGAIALGSFIWATDQTITFLKWIIGLFFGG